MVILKDCRGWSKFRPPIRHAPQAPTTYNPKVRLVTGAKSRAALRFGDSPGRSFPIPGLVPAPENLDDFTPAALKALLLEVLGRVAQLRAIGIDISQRQVVRLLTAGRMASSPRSVTCCGRGWRRRPGSRSTTSGHAMPERTASAPDQKPALRLVRHDGEQEPAELPRAAARRPRRLRHHVALAYLRERGLAGPLIAGLADDVVRHFADSAAWTAHLDRLGIHGLEGSIAAHGFLRDAIILSDDAGQVGVGRHALCWVHAERLVHRLDTFTNDQHAAQGPGPTALSGLVRSRQQADETSLQEGDTGYRH